MQKETNNIFIKHGFNKSENGHIIRISDLIWCEIDENGFAELRRKRELPSGKRKYDKIIIPKPVRIEKDLKLLLSVLNGK